MKRRTGDSNGYERRSATTVFGLPLIHIVGGRDPFTGKRRMACGVVAIGQFAIGVVSICQFGAGVVAVSQFAVGALFGVGQFIVAPVAISQFAVAVFGAVGQFACALFSAGQFAAHVGDGGVGQSSVSLGQGPGAWALAFTPAVAGWLIAARVLRGLGAASARSRHARELPRIAPSSIGELQLGRRVLRATVARGQGTLFDASELTPIGEHRARLSVPEFVVEDEFGRAVVTCSNAEAFIAGRGRRVALEEGDVVEVLGLVHQTPDPEGKASDYRRPPARWTVEAETIAGHQTIATVRAMARFPSRLAWPMVLAAVLTLAAVVGRAVLG